MKTNQKKTRLLLKKNNPPLCRWGKPRWQGAQNPGFRWNYVRVQNSSFEDSMARSPRQGPHGKVMRSRLNWNLRPKKTEALKTRWQGHSEFSSQGFRTKIRKICPNPWKIRAEPMESQRHHWWYLTQILPLHTQQKKEITREKIGPTKILPYIVQRLEKQKQAYNPVKIWQTCFFYRPGLYAHVSGFHPIKITKGQPRQVLVEVMVTTKHWKTHAK